MPSWMQFDTPSFMKSAPAATTMQFESEPAGAEARTSLGQACRTPCTQTVTASEFTVSFSLPGYQPQTVPVRVVASADGSDAEGARLVPNPVFVELQPAGPAPGQEARSGEEKAEGRAAAGADRHGARAGACPCAGLALAARALKPRDFAEMTKRPPMGGRIPFAFLDITRTGSLKRSRSGA